MSGPSGDRGAPARTAAGGLPSGLRNDLQQVEELGLRGKPDSALARLAELQSDISPDAVEQRVAIAEHAMSLGRMGGSEYRAQEICDRALDGMRDAGARGRVLLSRGQVSTGAERRRYHTAALTELSIADDERGQALALGFLAFPIPDDDEVSHAYRARLGEDGLQLAIKSGEPYVIAVCAGNLAACETYLGRATALERWRLGADLMPSAMDARTAHVVALNRLNWALTALGYGDYYLAARVLSEGSALARGRYWERGFAAVEALVAYRRGDLAHAVEAAGRAREGGADERAAIGTVVAVACAFERESRPDVRALDPAVDLLVPFSEQLGATALAVRAKVRAARREPEPARGLRAALRQARHRGRRFGWEDLVLALAEIRPEDARAELAALAQQGDLWPAGARPAAVRTYVNGLVANDHGALLAAGEALLALSEPVTAGQALHAAAHVAPDTETGNRLRLRAVELFKSAGADRSLATVLREGRLRRTKELPRIPETQRSAVHAGLTPREHEVALLAQKALTAREIAERLSLAEGTVRNHLLRIRQKFGGIPKRKLGELLSPDEPGGDIG
jgi:DNA-binding CsgD family transcriptional regulator